MARLHPQDESGRRQHRSHLRLLDPPRGERGRLRFLRSPRHREVFEDLPWNDGDIEVFHEMWNWANEAPVVLGGYYTGRYLTNAFTSVVVSGNVSVRDALEDAVEAINKELKIKQEEYGVFYDNEK